MKKIALIGVGGYATVYYHALVARATEKKIELAAVVIRNPDKEPEKCAVLNNLGTRIYNSESAMYDGETGVLDLVCVPTGIQYHEGMTVDALRRGFNVLVEKPVAGSIDAVRRMIDAERASNAWVAVGFQHIYDQTVQQIKKLLMAGEIGTVKSVSVMGLWPRDNNYYNRNQWAGKIKCNGEWVLDSPINNAFAHYLNIALFWCGRRFDEMARCGGVEAELYRARSIETFDTCSIRFITEDNVPLLCHFSHASETTVDPRIRVEGDAGVVEWAANAEYVVRKASGDELRGVSVAPGPQMFDAVIAKLSEPETFSCSLRMGGNHSYGIDLIHKHGRVTDIPDEYFSIHPENGTYQISDIAQYFTRAFTENKLLSELRDIPWSSR